MHVPIPIWGSQSQQDSRVKNELRVYLCVGACGDLGLFRRSGTGGMMLCDMCILVAALICVYVIKRELNLYSRVCVFVCVCVYQWRFGFPRTIWNLRYDAL